MKNIRKSGSMIIAALLLMTLLSCYSGPKSMMPAKWTDVVTSQASRTDFTSVKEMVLSGTLEGEEGEAVYEVRHTGNTVVYNQVSSDFSSDKLDRIISVALLTEETAVMITDSIQTTSDKNSMWQLDKWSLIRNYNFFDDSRDTEVETFIWSEDLRLQRYTYTAKEGSETISDLTATFR